MTPPVHFKVAYHSDVVKSVVINIDFKAARRIWEVTLKNPITTSTVAEKGPQEINMFDLDVREYEVIPISDRDFEVIQLYDNPIWSSPFGCKYRTD